VLKEGYFGIKENNLIVIVYYIAALLQRTEYSIQNMRLHVDCDELFGDDTLGKNTIRDLDGFAMILISKAQKHNDTK